MTSPRDANASASTADPVDRQVEQIRRIAGDFDLGIEAQLNRIAIRVVIMGPAMDGPAEKLSPAARLRKELIRQCSAIGTLVTPEHRVLIDIARRQLGEGHDLCTYESHLVVHICDLLVIIPSSPGSFCELGYFAVLNDACKKMIVFADSTHRRPGSYVEDGPLTAASNRRAVVQYISYESDGETAFRLVKAEIQRIRAQRSIQQHQRGIELP